MTVRRLWRCRVLPKRRLRALATLGEPCDYPLGCRRPLVCGLDKTCRGYPISQARHVAEAGMSAARFASILKRNKSITRAMTASSIVFRHLQICELKIPALSTLLAMVALARSWAWTFQRIISAQRATQVEGFALNVPVFFRLSDYVMTGIHLLGPENDSYPTYVEPIGGAVFEREGDEAPDAAVEEAQFCTKEVPVSSL